MKSSKMRRKCDSGITSFQMAFFALNAVFVAAVVCFPIQAGFYNDASIIVANCPLNISANLDLRTPYSNCIAQGIRGKARSLEKAIDTPCPEPEVNNTCMCVRFVAWYNDKLNFENIIIIIIIDGI